MLKSWAEAWLCEIYAADIVMLEESGESVENLYPAFLPFWQNPRGPKLDLSPGAYASKN
jgi:hypothetical protein